MACLQLADCYSFGLKGEYDLVKAHRLYKRAANAGSAEAWTQMAQVYYFLYLHDCGITPPPPHVIDASDPPNPKGHFESMWYCLEMAASQGYASLLLLERAKDARASGTWRLSEDVRKLIEERNKKVEKELKDEKMSFKFGCKNPQCTFKCTSESLLIVCGQCRKVGA